MNSKENYVLNEESDVTMLEYELAENVTMMYSMLNALYVELIQEIKQADKQQFVVLLFKQMEEVQLLYNVVYEKKTKLSGTRLFVLNPDMDKHDLHLEFIGLLYLLNSLCVITYDVLLDEINAHLLNTFAVLMRAAGKMVQIEERLSLLHGKCR